MTVSNPIADGSFPSSSKSESSSLRKIFTVSVTYLVAKNFGRVNNNLTELLSCLGLIVCIKHVESVTYLEEVSPSEEDDESYKSSLIFQHSQSSQLAT